MFFFFQFFSTLQYFSFQPSFNFLLLSNLFHFRLLFSPSPLLIFLTFPFLSIFFFSPFFPFSHPSQYFLILPFLPIFLISSFFLIFHPPFLFPLSLFFLLHSIISSFLPIFPHFLLDELLFFLSPLFTFLFTSFLLPLSPKPNSKLSSSPQSSTSRNNNK